MTDSAARYVAVIPAYNEAATIREIVARTVVHVPEIIVIDDGSEDGTADALRELPVTVRRHDRNLGKGTALWHGMQEASARGATAILTLDGDGQHEPESIPRLLARHRRSPHAIVIGSRLHERHAMPAIRYIANRVANFWIAWACGQPLADSQSGLRVYPASLFGMFTQACDHTKGFVFESEVLIEAARRGVPIISVPVTAVYGRHLRRSHFRQGRDIGRITRMVARKLLARRLDLPALLRSRRRYRPEEILVPACPENGVPRAAGSVRRRVLFVAEAVSLAHVARAVSMARLLDPARYDVHVACDPRYTGLFTQVPFQFHPLRSIGSEQFQDRLRRGDPLYTVTEVRQYVKDDLRVIDSVTPAAIIGDFRLSLSVSARVMGLPYVAITNAHWSPYARPRFIIPELAIAERFGPRCGQLVFDLIRPVVFAHQAHALNRVRREYGLPAAGYSLSRIFTEADMTVYADVPALVPTVDLPGTHCYVSPPLWSPDVFPAWWHSVPENQAVVYVSLGSSGRSELLPYVLGALERLGVAVILSTSGRGSVASKANRVWMADYVPGLQAAERASFVICNGGSAAVYQALAAGKPVLGIPNNLDQYLMMHYVGMFGAGLWVRAGHATAERLTEAGRHILEEARYGSRAVELQAAIRSGHGAVSFPHLVDGLVEGKTAREPDAVCAHLRPNPLDSDMKAAAKPRDGCTRSLSRI